MLWNLLDHDFDDNFVSDMVQVCIVRKQDKLSGNSPVLLSTTVWCEKLWQVSNFSKQRSTPEPGRHGLDIVRTSISRLSVDVDRGISGVNGVPQPGTRLSHVSHSLTMDRQDIPVKIGNTKKWISGVNNETKCSVSYKDTESTLSYKLIINISGHHQEGCWLVRSRAWWVRT